MFFISHLLLIQYRSTVPPVLAVPFQFQCGGRLFRNYCFVFVRIYTVSSAGHIVGKVVQVALPVIRSVFDVSFNVVRGAGFHSLFAAFKTPSVLVNSSTILGIFSSDVVGAISLEALFTLKGSFLDVSFKYLPKSAKP